MSRRERARDALARGWFWGVDYGWVLREIGRGIAEPRLPAAFSEGVRAPVLLIPGVLENWTMMRTLAAHLSRAGHPVHALPELQRNTATVREASAIGTAYVAAQDLRDLVIVAHSKGGLVGKHMMLSDADSGEHRIRSMVAIAAPFAGSSLARLFPSSLLRQLDPRDETISELARRPEANARITSIYGPFDPHIPGGSRLEGATNVPVGAMGHFRILADPRAIAATIKALQ